MGSKEYIKLSLKGFWKDVITHTLTGEVEETPWSKNQIQDSQATLSAILFSQVLSGEISAYGGIQYMAIGEGDPDWDLTPPTKPNSQTTLEDEIDRIVIVPETGILFLDPDTLLPSVTPTRVLEITVFIDTTRGLKPNGEGDLREFGLFGGNATDTVDSGYMINWISHDLISKNITDPIEIQRTIRLFFQLEE